MNEYNSRSIDTGLPLLYKIFLPLSPSPGCWVLASVMVRARYIPSCEVSSISARLGGCCAAEQSRSVVIHMLMFTLHCVTFSTIPHNTPPSQHSDTSNPDSEEQAELGGSSTGRKVANLTQRYIILHKVLWYCYLKADISTCTAHMSCHGHVIFVST